MAEIMAIGQNETCLEMSPQILQPPWAVYRLAGTIFWTQIQWHPCLEVTPLR